VKKLGCFAALLGLILFGLPLGLAAMAAPGRKGDEVKPVGAVAGIPGRMLSAYQRAAAQVGKVSPSCRGMTWSSPV
jgi:hypothetical protein